MIAAGLRATLVGIIGVGLIYATPETRALAQDHPKAKTEVGIIFEMPDPRYTDEFKNEVIPVLKEAAAAAIARVLNDKIRFLDFSTNAEASYLLTVRLDRAEGSRALGPAEFGFHLFLTGPEVRDDPHGYLEFRAKDEYLSPIGDRKALVLDIEVAMSRADHGELVKNILHNVVLSEEGDLNSQPLGWIIHRDRAAMCVDRDSRLKVSNAFPSSLGPAHETFEARVLNIDRLDGWIVSIADTSVHPDMIEQLKAADPVQVRVERVFIVDYRRFCGAQSVPANQVDFSTTGGSQ